MALLRLLNPPLLPWAKARVWVIGASTGIGAATAQALLAAGARVALSARRADKLQALAANAEPTHSMVEPLYRAVSAMPGHSPRITRFHWHSAQFRTTVAPNR